jgi:hypothetical protein
MGQFRGDVCRRTSRSTRATLRGSRRDSPCGSPLASARSVDPPTHGYPTRQPQRHPLVRAHLPKKPLHQQPVAGLPELPRLDPTPCRSEAPHKRGGCLRRVPPLAPQQQHKAGIDAADDARHCRRQRAGTGWGSSRPASTSSRCSLSWKISTGSIPPRWSCSASWSIKAHRPHPGVVHLWPRLQPALDGALAPHPDDAHPLAAAPGRRVDWPGGAWQGPAPRGRRASRRRRATTTYLIRHTSPPSRIVLTHHRRSLAPSRSLIHGLQRLRRNDTLEIAKAATVLMIMSAIVLGWSACSPDPWPE